MCLSRSLSIDNGIITYSSGTTEPHDFGTIAVYTCDRGFSLDGGNGLRTCSGNITSPTGTWSGPAPKCSGRNS